VSLGPHERLSPPKMIQVPLWLIISLAFLVSASMFRSGMTPSAFLGPALCYMLAIMPRLVQLMQAPLQCAAACYNLLRPRPPPLPDPSLSTVSPKSRDTRSFHRFNTNFIWICVLMHSLQLVSASKPSSFTSAVSSDWYFSSVVCVGLLWLYPFCGYLLQTLGMLLHRSPSNKPTKSPDTTYLHRAIFLCTHRRSSRIIVPHDRAKHKQAVLHQSWWHAVSRAMLMPFFMLGVLLGTQITTVWSTLHPGYVGLPACALFLWLLRSWFDTMWCLIWQWLDRYLWSSASTPIFTIFKCDSRGRWSILPVTRRSLDAMLQETIALGNFFTIMLSLVAIPIILCWYFVPLTASS
jgi:hypothetical protein